MGTTVNEEMRSAATICLMRLYTYVDNLRAYNVFIDGAFVGRIRQGTTRTYNVQPGYHTVILRVDWLRSPNITVDCAADDVVRLICSGQPNPVRAVFRMVFAADRYIKLRCEFRE